MCLKQRWFLLHSLLWYLVFPQTNRGELLPQGPGWRGYPGLQPKLPDCQRVTAPELDRQFLKYPVIFKHTHPSAELILEFRAYRFAISYSQPNLAFH